MLVPADPAGEKNIRFDVLAEKKEGARRSDEILVIWRACRIGKSAVRQGALFVGEIFGRQIVTPAGRS